MNKFLKKLAWFVIPAFILIPLTEYYYSPLKGDLLRMSYMADTFDYDHKELFKEEFKKRKHYTKLSEINAEKKHYFKYLVIGDSFSDLDSVSYYNYLAEDDKAPVLVVDRYINDNTLETLQGLMNGGFFKNIEIDYVILQSVERELVRRRNFDKQKLITKDTVAKRIKEHKEGLAKKFREEAGKDKLFTNRNLKFLRNNFLYLFDDNAVYSETYMTDLNEDLFSANEKKLLFFMDDIKRYDENSNPENIKALNDELNTLSAKLSQCCKTKLIVLPAPDKFSIYYDYITNKSEYKYSAFFEKFTPLKKSYLYIDSKKTLSELIKKKKDVYYFDDSHWSPIAAKAIGREIARTVKNTAHQPAPAQ